MQYFTDWNGYAERAKSMTDLELQSAIRDCKLAGDIAWASEKAGNRVLKSQGWYSDESSVYHAELKLRSPR